MLKGDDKILARTMKRRGVVETAAALAEAAQALAEAAESYRKAAGRVEGAPDADPRNITAEINVLTEKMADVGVIIGQFMSFFPAYASLIQLWATFKINNLRKELRGERGGEVPKA